MRQERRPVGSSHKQTAPSCKVERERLKSDEISGAVRRSYLLSLLVASSLAHVPLTAYASSPSPFVQQAQYFS